MENNDVIELLDSLYSMVTEAWGVPLGNDKCIIEREKAIEIIGNESQRRKEAVPTTISTDMSSLVSYPIEVEVGGATIFVLNVEDFRKL